MISRSRNSGWQAGLVCLGVALAMVGCNGSDSFSGGCAQSCDLAQCFWVKVSGAVPAAEILVSEACGGGGKCPESGCHSVMLCLKSPPPSGEDISCHVTASSAHGDVVEIDAVASITSCCPGYAFPKQPITISFPPPEDGGVDGESGDGGAGEDAPEPAEAGL